MQNPTTVISPRAHWKLIGVIFDGGADSFSIAYGMWAAKMKIVCRWNGSSAPADKGTPQSRGHPTWFILPDIAASGILNHYLWLCNKQDKISTAGINKEVLTAAAQEYLLK
jgi:hypothetical protein